MENKEKEKQVKSWKEKEKKDLKRRVLSFDRPISKIITTSQIDFLHTMPFKVMLRITINEDTWKI